MFKWKSLIPLIVIAVLVIVAFVLCSVFGTVVADGTGFTGHWEFSF